MQEINMRINVIGPCKAVKVENHNRKCNKLRTFNFTSCAGRQKPSVRHCQCCLKIEIQAIFVQYFAFIYIVPHGARK